MFVRLTFCKFSPETIKDAKNVYMKEIAPAIKQQKGNIAVHFLEPVDKAEDFISITEWKTKADAEAYENSGLYKKLVNKLQSYFSKPPVLKTYSAEEAFVTTL